MLELRISLKVWKIYNMQFKFLNKLNKVDLENNSNKLKYKK